MQTILRGLAAALLAISFTVPAYAHDESLHKGKPTHGEITSISGNELEVKTAKGPLKVRLDEQTIIESGDRKAERSALTVGSDVTVFGTRLPGNVLVAREVLLQSKAAPAEHHHDSDTSQTQ